MATLQDVNVNVFAKPEAKRIQTFLNLSQNENGRVIYFRILGVDELPSGATAILAGTKPDGNAYSTTGTVDGNFVIVNEDVQMTAVAGVWDAKLDIISGDNNIMTAVIRFVIDADPSEDGVESDSELSGLVAEAKYYAENARSAAYGSPLVASTAAEMTDTSRVYVYTGSESGYSSGYWYYYDGSAWTAGGSYNSTAVTTDTTLSLDGVPADAAAVGDAFTTINADLTDLETNVLKITERPAKNLNITPYPDTATVNGVAFTKNSDGSIGLSGAPTKAIYWPNATDTSLRWELPAGTYTLSGGLGATEAVNLVLYAEKTDTTYTLSYSCGTNNAEPVTFTTDKSYWAMIRFVVTKNAPVNPGDTFYPQLETGTEKTDYENPWDSFVSRSIIDDLLDADIDIRADFANLSEEVTATAESVDEKISSIDSRMADIDGIRNIEYEIGNVTVSGGELVYSTNNKRIRTKQGTSIYLEEGQVIKIVEGYRFYLCYQKDGVWRDGQSWHTSDFTILHTGNYVVDVTAVPEAVISDIDTVASAITFPTDPESLRGEVERISKSFVPETGNKTYHGQRIELASYNSDETHKCDVNLWETYTADNISSDTTASKALKNNQSMTIFGGYMFLFSENGGGAVIDMATKEMLSAFTTEPTANNHQNSAEFSDIYYDASDEFPLLFVSRCGNVSWTSGEHDLDGILVYRIQKSGTAFTFTLVNTIRSNVQTYGTTWGVNNVTRELYCVGIHATDDTRDKLEFFVYEMPKTSDILSETEIVLPDYKGHFETEYTVFQGACVNDGKFYVGVSVPNSYRHEIWIYDMTSGILVTELNIINGWEIEGVAIYDGKIYTTNKNGENLRVYEVTP